MRVKLNFPANNMSGGTQELLFVTNNPEEGLMLKATKVRDAKAYLSKLKAPPLWSSCTHKEIYERLLQFKQELALGKNVFAKVYNHDGLPPFTDCRLVMSIGLTVIIFE